MLINAQPSQEQIQTAIIEINNAESTVATTLEQELNAEKDRLIAELQREFPAHAWDEVLVEIERLKSEDDLLCDNPIIENAGDDHEAVKKARTLLAEYGINPAKVNVYSVDEPSNGSFASAGQGYDGTIIHELKINIAKFSTLSNEIQEAIIRHEIMHLLNYDSLEYIFITTLLEEIDIKPEYIILTKPSQLIVSTKNCAQISLPLPTALKLLEPSKKIF